MWDFICSQLGGVNIEGDCVEAEQERESIVASGIARL